VKSENCCQNVGVKVYRIVWFHNVTLGGWVCITHEMGLHIFVINPSCWFDLKTMTWSTSEIDVRPMSLPIYCNDFCQLFRYHVLCQITHVQLDIKDCAYVCEHKHIVHIRLAHRTAPAMTCWRQTISEVFRRWDVN